MGDRAGSKLVRGTVDLMVLRCLDHGPKHGLAIARWIKTGSGDVVSFQDAALYQSLHRLERQGLVSSSWGRTEGNRRARIYTLTAKGRRRLEAEAREFRSLAGAIERLLELDGGGS